MIGQQLKKIISNSFIGKIYKNYRKQYRKKCADDQKIDRFLQLHNIQDGKIKKDIYDSIEKYHISIEEYFQFGFISLSQEERKNFVPESKRNSYCDTLNKIENRETFINKFQTYQKFKEFYHRDVFGINSPVDFTDEELLTKFYDDFNAFIQQHHEFITKPLRRSMGEGITFRTVDKPDDVDGVKDKDLLKSLKAEFPRGFVLEEKICQVPEMAKLHPKSVNTLRMTTIRLDDRIVVFHPVLRIGRGDSIVDNASAGGIIASLDNNGKIKAAGDEMGFSYTRLDDMGMELIGWQVPCWQEAVDLVKQLAMVVPSNRYAGWDIALTDKGWCMVEGNSRGQFIWQIADHAGCKDEIDRIMAELKKS